jgi:hypothetical protein
MRGASEGAPQLFAARLEDLTSPHMKQHRITQLLLGIGSPHIPAPSDHQRRMSKDASSKGSRRNGS